MSGKLDHSDSFVFKHFSFQFLCRAEVCVPRCASRGVRPEVFFVVNVKMCRYL